MRRTAELMLFLLIGFFSSGTVLAQDLSQNPLPNANAFLDVYFKHKNEFIDDILIDEINIKSRDNTRIVAVRPIDEIPLHTSILIDLSGSQVRYVNELRSLYVEMIHALPLRSVDATRLIYFNDGISAMRNETSSLSLLLKGFDNVKFVGSTVIYDAIYYTCQMMDQYPESRKVMIILSDGKDNESSKSIEEAYREVIAKNIRVYMFAIVNGLKNSFSDLLSTGYMRHEKYINKSGGKLVFVSDLESASENFRQIVGEWKHLKRIDLYIDPSGKNVSDLKISVSRKGVTAVHTSSIQIISMESQKNSLSQ